MKREIKVKMHDEEGRNAATALQIYSRHLAESPLFLVCAFIYNHRCFSKQYLFENHISPRDLYENLHKKALPGVSMLFLPSFNK